MDAIKGFINLFADPRLFFVLTVVALAFIVWKRELFRQGRGGIRPDGVSGRCSSASA